MKRLNALKPVGEICEEVSQFSSVTADVCCVQATIISLLTVKLMDHFLRHRLSRAAPGRTPNTAVLFRCTCAAY